jgi:hypothetical protein
MDKVTATPEMLAWLESHAGQTSYVQGLLAFQERFDLMIEDAMKIVDEWTEQR